MSWGRCSGVEPSPWKQCISWRLGNLFVTGFKVFRFMFQCLLSNVPGMLCVCVSGVILWCWPGRWWQHYQARVWDLDLQCWVIDQVTVRIFFFGWVYHRPTMQLSDDDLIILFRFSVLYQSLLFNVSGTGIHLCSSRGMVLHNPMNLPAQLHSSDFPTYILDINDWFTWKSPVWKGKSRETKPLPWCPGCNPCWFFRV